MAIFETEGIILKSYTLAEADKIIVILTKDEGLIRAVAKGAKRLKSRFGGSLEPFTIVQISYYQKEERELVSINQIDLLKSFFESAGNPEFLQKFSYLSELIVNFAPPHDPNEKLYRMARICLETAAEHTESLESISLYFELWILRLGGYLPQWERCDICKRDLGNIEAAGLQANFQLICENCRKSRSGWKVNWSQRKFFASAQRSNPAEFIKFAWNNPADIKELSVILKRIISGILGREVTGDKVLQTKF